MDKSYRISSSLVLYIQNSTKTLLFSSDFCLSLDSSILTGLMLAQREGRRERAFA